MASLGTFSAGVAHQINNPLTYILANLDHVLRKLRAASASDDPLAELASGAGEGLPGLIESLEHVVNGAHRVRQVTRDLLTFSQGNVEQKKIVDLRGILESATQMAWHEIRHKARLTKRMAEVPPVEANEARLGQVFLNILMNAAQAIPEGKTEDHEIQVASRTDADGNAVIEITDTGVGIPKEQLPFVFDPFFTTKGEGTGLGLAVSHGTVKSLGGEITVESELGRGTLLRVVLRPAKTAVAPSSSHLLDVRPVEACRVLIIDDERLVAEAIARSLADDNRVEVMTDPREALARIDAGESFDVVLCDLMMPAMTGMDLYAEVLRRTPKLAPRLIFMTGGAFTPRARAFMESVKNTCLEKPLDMGRLRSLVARAGHGA